MLMYKNHPHKRKGKKKSSTTLTNVFQSHGIINLTFFFRKLILIFKNQIYVLKYFIFIFIFIIIWFGGKPPLKFSLFIYLFMG